MRSPAGRPARPIDFRLHKPQIEIMDSKTYAHLPDGLLKRLHCQAHKLPSPEGLQVARSMKGLIRVFSPTNCTVFDVKSGDINAFVMDHQVGINNLWQILKECREQGIDYTM